MKGMKQTLRRWGKQNERRKESGLLETAWKKFEKGGDWTNEMKNMFIEIDIMKDQNDFYHYHKKLLKDMRVHDIKVESVDAIKILLLGQIKSGNSSFLNTLATIDEERIAQITRAGGHGKSLTVELKEYKPTGILKNICILDTMGLEESTGGLNVKDVLPIVNGNTVAGYKFNHASPIEKESEYFRSNPEKGDRVHCVVFVVDANILGQNNVSDGTRRNIKEINEELRREDVPSFVLLTKIDNLCELVEKDIRNTYSSEKIKQAVDIAVELYNVPEQNIFPIKNYHSETERDTNKEILILLALRQMMYFGTDFLLST